LHFISDTAYPGKSVFHLPINHDAIKNVEVSWKVLLQECAAAEPGTTKILLSHRADMQHNACLDKEEKLLVYSIQRHFDMV